MKEICKGRILFNRFKPSLLVTKSISVTTHDSLLCWYACVMFSCEFAVSVEANETCRQRQDNQAEVHRQEEAAES